MAARGHPVGISSLSLHPVGLGDRLQVVSLGSKHLFSLNHLTGPRVHVEYRVSARGSRERKGTRKESKALLMPWDKHL